MVTDVPVREIRELYQVRGALAALMLQTRRYSRLALASPEYRRHSARPWQALLEAIRALERSAACRKPDRLQGLMSSTALPDINRCS